MAVKRLFAWLLILGLSSSCDRNRIGPQEPPQPPPGDNADFLVLNEGNFQWGNASIGTYREGEGYRDGLFRVANQEEPLGDVLQSMAQNGAEYWLVLNGSNLLRVVEAANWRQKAQYTALGAPRFLAFAPGQVWISDLYRREILVLDPQDGRELARLAVPAAGGRLVFQEGIMRCAAGRWYLRYRVQDFSEIERRRLPGDAERLLPYPAGSSLLVQQNQRAWLYHFDEEGEFRDSNELPGPARLLAKAPGAAHFFWLSGEYLLQWQAESGADSLYRAPWIARAYALSHHPQKKELLLSDPLDFQQASQIYRGMYNDSLWLPQNPFRAGAISNGFWFTR